MKKQMRLLLPLLCFVLISFCLSSVSSQTCMNDNGYFTPNSTYDANRRLILSSLHSNVTSQQGLFYYGSIGQEPNRVYAIGMCIPGSDPNDCSECIKRGSDDSIRVCTNQTSAYTYPGDPTLCLVRYSNTSFFGKSDINPRVLTNGAPNSSNNHYVANVTALATFQNIYAVMQCTPDISSSDCKNCLQQSASEYQTCCGQRQGGVVMRPSCFFRFEVYPYSKAFENIQMASPPPPVTPPQPAGDRTNNGRDNKGISAGIITAITVAIVVIILTLFGIIFVLRRKRRSYQRTEIGCYDISTEHTSLYDFKTIEAATNKFSESNKLGEGGFGEVYKGKLSNGTEVAVKRLSKKSGQGAREFKNEAVLVSKLQHRNLVRLFGFCLEGEEKILIYEFVPNKSLDYFLFDSEKLGQLNWTRRYKIIEGIARGILYLHQDSQLTIIHRDLKASNVLLDANMNPRISDFGLSTIFGIEQTQGNTNRIAGTYAYMSPEYAMHGQYSMKSDIYSFGVLVLEIISGKKNSDVYHIDETSTAGNLVNYAWRLWRNNSPLDLVDPTIRGNYQSNEVIRCIHIGLLCVQDNPEDRPMLSTIILMLTSNTITLPVPRLPRFFPRSKHELNPVSEGSESPSKSLITSFISLKY
ncbi:unnamed protein product [Cochlearia groenlandica]